VHYHSSSFLRIPFEDLIQIQTLSGSEWIDTSKETWGTKVKFSSNIIFKSYITIWWLIPLETIYVNAWWNFVKVSKRGIDRCLSCSLFSFTDLHRQAPVQMIVTTASQTLRPVMELVHYSYYLHSYQKIRFVLEFCNARSM
jgi:hypothetical protein